MSKILETKFGFLKHFFLGMFFLLGCYFAVLGEPFSATAVLISFAVSAAVTAATAGLTYLLTPRPKPVDKNKLQGEIQISSIGEDIFINEIYGARGADGKGGIKTGVNFFYIADIRGNVSSQSSSGGGGKGGKKPETKEHHYYTDLACLVALGRTRILEIRAGTDVLYRNYPKPTSAQGTHYQCEAGTLGGGATIESNSLFASGQAVKLPANGTITRIITGDGQNHAFYFQYLTATDKSLNITINGQAHTIALPKTYGRVESVMLIGSTNVGNTTIFIHSPANDNNLLWLDEIIVGENFVSQTEVTRFSGISGIKNENYLNPFPTYNYLTLRDPLSDDYRAADEYNYQVNQDNLGSSDVQLPAGCTLRIYEGTADQLPDPTLQAYFETKYGAGSTPAFRHRSYFVLDNFEITKYGQVPNITVIAESIDHQTLGAMYAHRAARAGLETTEFDFSDFDNIPLRGYAITSRQAPRSEMEVLNRIFDIDVYESPDGKVVGTVPTDNVLVQIPFNHLDVSEEKPAQDAKPIGIKTVIRNEYEIAKRFDFSYFNPTKDFEIGTAYASREVTVSERRENLESSLVLTDEEAQKITDRIFQQLWAEKDAEEFSTFYRYGWLKPTDLIEVVSLEGSVNRVRIKQRNGNIPGKLDFIGVSRNIAEPSPRIFLEPTNKALAYPWLNVPAHIIGTIIDMTILRSTETVSGFYAACAMTDQAYSFKGASLVWEREGIWESLQTFNAQAIMGRTITGGGGILADVPSGWNPNLWDTTSTVTFDLFFGEVETRTDAEVLEKFNTLIVGEEVIAFQTATRVNGYPNRWTVSRLRRRLGNTFANGHISGERVVLLNSAVKFIPLDLSEFGKTRSYKFLSAGQELGSAAGFAFTWDGNTNPQASKKDKGRDTSVVPQTAISAKVESVLVIGDHLDILLNISLNFLYDLSNNLIHNNTDSVDSVQVEVFNQFGESVQIFNPGAIGTSGGQFVCKFPRKYADVEAEPLQAYFKITVSNFFGSSFPVYLRGTTVTTSVPALRLRSQTPLEAYGIAISDNQIQVFHQFSGNVQILSRKVGEPNWVGTGWLSGSPSVLNNLSEINQYDIAVRSEANPNNWSNIFRIATKQQGTNAPTYPAPTGQNGTALSTSVLEFTCIAAANVATDVWVDDGVTDVYVTTLSAVAVGGLITFQITGLAANTTRGVRFQHNFGGGNYSTFTTKVTRTTNPNPPSEETPVIDSAYWDESVAKVIASFTPRMGSGDFIVQRKFGFGGSWNDITSSPVASTATTFDNLVFQAATAQLVTYRMKRAGSSLASPWSAEYEVWVPAFDGRGEFY